MARRPQRRGQSADQRVTAGASTKELGVAGAEWVANNMSQAEFLPELRGLMGLRKYREMKDNDPIIGAILHAIEMLLRRVQWSASPPDDSTAAREKAEFVDTVFTDMQHSWDDALSHILSFLPFGWSAPEMVFKRRVGPWERDPSRRSKYKDGLIGLRKLAPRPQETLNRWVFRDNELVAMVQNPIGRGGLVTIPAEKLLHLRTTNAYNSPNGRSMLRNAYKPYYFVTQIENIEAIAIERELNGLPIAYIPTEYLSPDSTSEQQAFVRELKKMLVNIRRNEQASAIFPSDPWVDDEGKMTSMKMFEFKLAASEGTRDIATDPVIRRYRQDIARTVLADFIMLGQGDRGSFALSKSKTDLFLAALEGYVQIIADGINQQLLPLLWRLNGFDYAEMPEWTPGPVAPVDLEELGEYIRNLAGAGFPLFPNGPLQEELMEAGDMTTEGLDDPDMLGQSGNPRAVAEEAEGDDGAPSD